MITGRTRPKENAQTGVRRALRPEIHFKLLHIIIKELVPFSKRRGLGHPQKQSPVLSVPEMYMEALLVRSIPIAEGLKTGQISIHSHWIYPLILALLPLSHRDNNTHQSRACHSIHVNHVPHRDTRIISRKARLKYRRAYHRCPAQIISPVSSTDPPYCP